MRFLVRACIPTEAGNAMIRDPHFSKKMETLTKEIKPEHAYFTVEAGQRTIYFVVNCQNAHDLPSIGEPLWLGFGAKVDFMPVMDQADFAKAAPHIERAAKNF